MCLRMYSTKYVLVLDALVPRLLLLIVQRGQSIHAEQIGSTASRTGIDVQYATVSAVRKYIEEVFRLLYNSFSNFAMIRTGGKVASVIRRHQHRKGKFSHSMSVL